MWFTLRPSFVDDEHIDGVLMVAAWTLALLFLKFW